MSTDLRLISFRDGSEVPVPGLDRPPSSGGPSLPLAGVGVVVRSRAIPNGLDAVAMLDRLRAAAAVRSSAVQRPLAGAVHDGRLVTAFEPPLGAPLRTVLRLVPLTADQAAAIGEGLLAALGALHRAGVAHGRVDSDHVRLGPDGGIRLAEPGFWVGPGAGGYAADLAAAVVVLAQVLDAVVGFRDAGPTAEALASLAEAQAAVGAGPDSPRAAPRALARWRRAAALDPNRRRRVRRQLAALGSSLPVGGDVPPAAPAAAQAGPGPTSAPSAAPTLLSPPPAPPPAGPALTAGWRRAGVAAALGLVLLVGGTAILALTSLPARAPARAGSNHRSPSALVPGITPVPTAGSTPPGPYLPQQIPLLGPPSSPPIQQVQLTGACGDGGGLCQVDLRADLGSHGSDTVAWKVELVDRCTGAVTTLATGTIAAPGYYTYVEAQPQVPLPAATSLALVALAGAPSMAASAPLAVGPPAASCAG